MRNNVGAGQRSPLWVPSRRADVHRAGAGKHTGIRGLGPALHKGLQVRLLALKAATTHAPHPVSLKAKSDQPTLFSGVTVGVIIINESFASDLHHRNLAFFNSISNSALIPTSQNSGIWYQLAVVVVVVVFCLEFSSFKRWKQRHGKALCVL